jgi:CHAT domain-containing protein/tetratricopeptide (TPR) repeat protein
MLYARRPLGHRHLEMAMNSRGLTKRVFCLLLLCLFHSVTGAQRSFAQNNDPQQLQKSGVARIDRWMDYVRRTGDATSTVSELATANSELKASFDLFLQRKDFAGASWSEIKMADIRRLMNRWAEATPVYQAAIELTKLANRPDYQTKALARLAYSELKTGNTDSALDHAREAVRLGANCGNKTFYFEALDTAGEVELTHGNLVGAGEYLDQALALSGQIEDKQQLYIGYSDRGEIYYQIALKCDYERTYQVCYDALDKAYADYEKALAITRELGYQFISQLFQHVMTGMDERKALIKRQQAEDQSVGTTKMFNPQKPGDVLVTENFTAGRMDAANLALIENVDSGVRDFVARMQKQGLIVQDLNPTDLWRQGSLAEMHGNNEAALAKYVQAVDLLERDRRKLRDEQERGAFMVDKIGYYYNPALIYLEGKHYPEAFALFERSRSRAMADMLASRPLTLGTVQERTLFSELETLRTAIAAQQEKLFNLTSSSNRDQNAKEIVRLESQISDQQLQYQNLEARIQKEAPKLGELTSSEPVTLAQVQRSATAGGYDVLYYVVRETSLVLWHINGSEVQVKNVFLPHNELIEKTVALNKSMVAPSHVPGTRFDEETSRQLYLFLVQPMLSYIKSNHIVIIPQEELMSLPFQALLNPETGKYLGESFEISYAPSATVLSTLESPPNLRSGHLLAVADPVLHDADDEVQAIGAVYPGRSKIVVHEQVDKAELTKWVGNYNLIHLSVHGRFDSTDPLLSFLQLTPTPSDNGRLTAAEMFGLPLQKNSLVVLSACETGLVRATHSSEVMGMVRSLLYAGAGDLVLSLWEVNAKSTRLWMETFYKEGQSKPPAEAAKLALVAVKSRPEYSHPFFWAPFVMTGK